MVRPALLGAPKGCIWSPAMTWSPPRQGHRERRQDRAESDCPENSSCSQSSGESHVRMSPTGSQTEPPACLCPGYTLPDLRLDSWCPGDPPTVCVSPVWTTGTQGHVGMSRAPEQLARRGLGPEHLQAGVSAFYPQTITSSAFSWKRRSRPVSLVLGDLETGWSWCSGRQHAQ